MLSRPAKRALLLLPPMLLSYASCRPPAAPAPVESRWEVMGTVAAVSLPASRAAAGLPPVRQAVSNCFAEVNRDFSVFLEASDLARINRAGVGEPVSVGAEMAAVLDDALRFARESGGAFDPTVGPLMRVWGFRGNGLKVAMPSADKLAAARRRVGWSNVVVGAAGSLSGKRDVRLKTAGMQVDLGGIAKGYAVDRAWARLRQTGQADFLVNLAGNMRGYGNAATDRRGWRVGVRDPFDADGLLGTLILTNSEAVATSGNYERFVLIDGIRYAHIMDPRTGRPVRGMAGVTVLAPTAMEADALSTTLFVLGAKAGARLLAQHPGCEAIFIPDEQPPRLLATPGILARFTLRAGARTRLQVLRVE